jgi:hypothetical protein
MMKTRVYLSEEISKPCRRFIFSLVPGVSKAAESDMKPFALVSPLFL